MRLKNKTTKKAYIAPDIELTPLDLGDLMGDIGASAHGEEADGPESWGAKAIGGTFFLDCFDDDPFTTEEVISESADEYEFQYSLN